MRKSDLINQISDKTGIPKVDVLVTLETMFKEVKESLSNGQNIYIRGFGSFITKKRAAKIGRNIKIRCLVTNHRPTNCKHSRRVLNEAHEVVYFPHSTSGRVKYLLIDYLGLDRKQVGYFRHQNSRWCCIYKNYPQIYMLEHEMGLLNNSDDD
jgi:nucleoid DNA-binding protein